MDQLPVFSGQQMKITDRLMCWSLAEPLATIYCDAAARRATQGGDPCVARWGQDGSGHAAPEGEACTDDGTDGSELRWQGIHTEQEGMTSARFPTMNSSGQRAIYAHVVQRPVPLQRPFFLWRHQY